MVGFQMVTVFFLNGHLLDEPQDKMASIYVVLHHDHFDGKKETGTSLLLFSQKKMKFFFCSIHVQLLDYKILLKARHDELYLECFTWHTHFFGDFHEYFTYVSLPSQVFSRFPWYIFWGPIFCLF